jgi:hypothetical protein
MKSQLYLRRSARSLTGIALFSAFLASVGLLVVQTKPAAQTKRQPQSKPPAKPEAKPAELHVSFRVGERLNYRVMWTKFLFHAANIEVAVTERRPFFGKEAWHFQAVARTIDAMRLLYALDDQFDGYVDVSNLETMQFEMYLREQGKKEDAKFRFSADGKPTIGDGAIARVRAGARDPLTYLYLLRTVTWQTTRQTAIPVFDGRKLYEVRARREIERGTVSVPAGTFQASRIEVRVYEKDKEVRQTRFWVWLGQDTGRTPVLIEVEIPFGTGRVELTRAEVKN